MTDRGSLSESRAAQIAVLIAAAVIAAAMIVAYLFPLASTDTLCRYAPMAEAFTVGDWFEAFHPRFAVGGTVVAGIFAFLPGFDGLTACTVSATLAWGLGGLVFFRLARRIFCLRTAFFALALYLVCPQPLVWALKGLRESFKMLGLILMVDAVVRARDSDRSSLPEACAAVAFLCLFKCDAILLALVLGFAFAVRDGFRVRTWLLATWGAVVLQPMCWLVWLWTGYWLPAPHYVPLWQKLFGV